MKNEKGKVYLVGAGPGDIGLITVKGMECLKKAETIVYDYHLNGQVLNYSNQDAEFIYAGKRGGHHTMTQDDINSTLIEKAKEGKIVCRLKGGDPFVFGRGGEEAEALYNEGIEFEVVPGVSSSVAAPAYAGIPLTHRHYSSTFAVIPGYEDTTKEESSIDLSKLATGVGTLVFLMAVKNIDILSEKLIKNGRPADTPVAIIRWGTRADQKTVIGTLGTIAQEVKQKDITPPAVMVVGDVVKLRDTLNWYEKKPLFGHRILVTRQTNKGFERLQDMGAEIVEFPTIRILPPESWDELDSCIHNINAYDWIILTSGSGVKYFFERYISLGKDIRDLKGIRFCAVGSKTAEKVNKMGIRVDLIPEEFRAEGLISSFKKLASSGELAGMRFLLPRAKTAREIFPETIRSLGGHIDVPQTYRSVKPEKHGKMMKRFLKEGRISVATFTSGATFDNFREMIGREADDLLRGLRIAAIGPVTAKTIEKAGHSIDIMPDESTIESLVDAIIDRLTKRNI